MTASCTAASTAGIPFYSITGKSSHEAITAANANIPAGGTAFFVAERVPLLTRPARARRSTSRRCYCLGAIASIPLLEVRALGRGRDVPRLEGISAVGDESTPILPLKQCSAPVRHGRCFPSRGTIRGVGVDSLTRACGPPVTATSPAACWPGGPASPPPASSTSDRNSYDGVLAQTARPAAHDRTSLRPLRVVPTSALRRQLCILATG